MKRTAQRAWWCHHNEALAAHRQTAQAWSCMAPGPASCLTSSAGKLSRAPRSPEKLLRDSQHFELCRAPREETPQPTSWSPAVSGSDSSTSPIKGPSGPSAHPTKTHTHTHCLSSTLFGIPSVRDQDGSYDRSGGEGGPRALSWLRPWRRVSLACQEALRSSGNKAPSQWLGSETGLPKMSSQHLSLPSDSAALVSNFWGRRKWAQVRASLPQPRARSCGLGTTGVTGRDR